MSRAEQIREFRILPTDFSEAGGELTPTLKVKRAVVARTYADEIAALYAGAPVGLAAPVARRCHRRPGRPSRPSARMGGTGPAPVRHRLG